MKILELFYPQFLLNFFKMIILKKYQLSSSNVFQMVLCHLVDITHLETLLITTPSRHFSMTQRRFCWQKSYSLFFTMLVKPKRRGVEFARQTRIFKNMANFDEFCLLGPFIDFIKHKQYLLNIIVLNWLGKILAVFFNIFCSLFEWAGGGTSLNFW